MAIRGPDWNVPSPNICRIADGSAARHAGSNRRTSPTPSCCRALKDDACILLVNVDFTDGESEIYVLPIALAPGDRAKEIGERSPDQVIAHVSHGANGNVCSRHPL